jgi:NADPH2:quinone reductase
MLQGLTAQYLVRDSYRVKAGDTVLVHAGAGGTGSILIQLAKTLGATVITTVSTEAKAAIARAAGADHVVMYGEPDWPQQVRELTGGKGVHAVYDGVGKSTWEGSMQCCRKLATVVLFGNASGPVPPVDPLLLTKYGSIFITRPTLADHLETRADFIRRADEVFGWVAAGKLKLSVYKTLPLAQAAEAHALLESRAATGKIVLDVADLK